jgi:hypothetical protein
MANRRLDTTTPSLRCPSNYLGFVAHRPDGYDLAELELQPVTIAFVAMMDKPRSARRVMDALPPLARHLMDEATNGDFTNSIA